MVSPAAFPFLTYGEETMSNVNLMRWSALFLAASVSLLLPACGDEGVGSAMVSLHNDFNNPDMARQPPWTICKSAYLGTEFGRIDLGETSAEQEVAPGFDHVLMVAAWNDPDCDPAHALPIASKVEEEVVDGQTRIISIGLTNHQGPCPPEGVQPIPQAQYDRILALWPEFGFKPYAERTANPQCL